MGRRNLMHTKHGPWLIAPPITDYLQNFFDTRVGFAKNTTTGYGVGVDVYKVKNLNPTGADSLGAALANTSSNARIEFDPTCPVGDINIANHGSLTSTSNTLLTGYGWGGRVVGSINFANTSNCTVMYMTVTQPFAYNTNPSGPCINFGNVKNAYAYRNNVWDSGDVLMSSGAYSPQGIVAPYWATFHLNRFGPNPGPYAMMAPILKQDTFTNQGAWATNTAYPAKSYVTYGGYTWYAPNAVPALPTLDLGYWGRPGWKNGIDNDAKNGKAANSAYDHNYIDGTAKTVTVTFTDTTHFTFAADGSTNFGNGFTNVMGANISAGSDGEGVAYTMVDSTHGVLTTGSYSGANASMSVQVYKPSAPPHPDKFYLYDKSFFMTMYQNVFQGAHLRNGKCRSQYVDFVSNLTAKWGTPFDTAGTGHWGGGFSLEDDGVANHEGNVYVPRNPGEYDLGFLPADADANGITPYMTCDSGGSLSPAIVSDGLASATPDGINPNKGGNLFVSTNNYLAGKRQDSFYQNTGFDRTSNSLWASQTGLINGYTLPTTTVSTTAGAQALITQLEDTSSTRAGNPHSPIRSWRQTHTGSTFPNP